MNTIDYIYRDLKEILETVVIKYDKKAKDAETVETRRDSDKYVNAVLELDTFKSHSRFSKDAIRNCGVFNEDLVEQYHADKYQIPKSMRARVVEEERFLIVENYEEKNNYYRELIGLPNTDDFDHIYLPLDICEKYKLDASLAIHEYRDDEIYKIERTIIPSLIAQYPDKRYLRYLGNNKVDLIKARQAQNFEIIHSSMIQETTFLNKFYESYMSCREYFTSVIYVKEFSSRYDLYDNFIAMNIMLMCIQRLMVNTIQIGIHRDFYDLHSIQALFTSYGLPFFEDLPLDYQRSIMKNLNMLLRYKSTDKVLYDISNILFFDRIKIFKYFLIKDREFDKKGNPIFAFKEVENEFGEIELVEDVEKMYSFYFQSTDILERNTALALENSQNKLSFEEVTESDMFWWNDEDVQKVLYEQEYNYVETKYLSVNVMYRITETMFESIYALNMLADKKDSSTESIFITLPRISMDRVSVFDAIIALFALTSKKCGMKGNIISQPAQILSVLGFNFKANFEEIIEQVYANERYLPQEIVRYLVNIDITTPKDINDMYYNIKWLADFLTDRMNNTTSLKEYRACRDLYKTLMIKDYTSEILKKRDGSIASTYLDYLLDQNAKLGAFVDNCPKNDVDVYMKHIIGKINELIPELEHMSTLEGSDNTLINALMKLIEFFKSYTVDLNSLNVLYVMDSKYYNMIRMVHDIKYIDKMMQYNENSFREYFDNISTHVLLDGKDQLEYLHKCFVNKSALFKYLHEILDTEYINKTLGLTTNIPKLSDSDRIEISKIIESFDESYIASTQEYHINIDMENKYTMKHLIREIVTNILIKDSSNMNLYNDTVEIICKDQYKFNIHIDEFVAFFAKLYIDEYLTIDEKCSIASIVDCKEFMMEDYIDIIIADSKIDHEFNMGIKDEHHTFINLNREDGWFNGLKTKLQNLSILSKVKYNLQRMEVIRSFKELNEEFNMTIKEWEFIQNQFDIMEAGYAGIEFWYSGVIESRMSLIDEYRDLVYRIKTISIRNNIKPSDMCKMYISISRTDKLFSLEKCKYNIDTLIENAIRSINKEYLDKYMDSSFSITTRELYNVYRVIHREDRVGKKDTRDKDVYVRNRLLFNNEIELRVKSLTNYSIYMEKTTHIKQKANLSDTMRVFLRHNLKSTLNIIEKMAETKNMDLSLKLIDIYNGYNVLLKSLIDISPDNIPLKDANPVTIIRHNFEELNTILGKVYQYKSNTDVWDYIFNSYSETLNRICKLLKGTENAELDDDIVRMQMEALVVEYIDNLSSNLNHVSANIDYTYDDIKNLVNFLYLFGNIYINDRMKLVSKIQRVHVNIITKYLIQFVNDIEHIDSIMYYNSTINALLFNNMLLEKIIIESEKFGLCHEISTAYKEFYREINTDIKEIYSISDIIEVRKSLHMLYSEYVHISNNMVYKDKTNMEDRIKVFYE